MSYSNLKIGRSHLPENSILFVNRPFSAQFSNCCNLLNFEAKINFNTTRQNDLKWRKTCTGLKFDLEHFNGPQTKFIGDSLYKHPVYHITQYINCNSHQPDVAACSPPPLHTTYCSVTDNMISLHTSWPHYIANVDNRRQNMVTRY